MPNYIQNVLNLFNIISYLNEEVNCTEPSPSFSFPWVNLQRVITDLRTVKRTGQYLQMDRQIDGAIDGWLNKRDE
jgi:hypothetical protein